MTSDLYKMRTKDVMSRDLVTINAGDSVHDALQLMAENKVSALPVVDHQDRCIGLLSTSDLIEVTRDVDSGLSELEKTAEPLWSVYLDKLGDHVGHQNVMDLMSDTVISVGPDTPLYKAAGRMLRDHIHRLPIIDNNDRLLGIVSTTDILAVYVECAPVVVKKS